MVVEQVFVAVDVVEAVEARCVMSAVLVIMVVRLVGEPRHVVHGSRFHPIGLIHEANEMNDGSVKNINVVYFTYTPS